MKGEAPICGILGLAEKKLIEVKTSPHRCIEEIF